jgi:hypothetical protein
MKPPVEQLFQIIFNSLSGPENFVIFLQINKLSVEETLRKVKIL